MRKMFSGLPWQRPVTHNRDCGSDREIAAILPAALVEKCNRGRPFCLGPWARFPGEYEVNLRASVALHISEGITAMPCVQERSLRTRFVRFASSGLFSVGCAVFGPMSDYVVVKDELKSPATMRVSRFGTCCIALVRAERTADLSPLLSCCVL